jgi:hypothetical protein
MNLRKITAAEASNLPEGTEFYIKSKVKNTDKCSTMPLCFDDENWNHIWLENDSIVYIDDEDFLKIINIKPLQ